MLWPKAQRGGLPFFLRPSLGPFVEGGEGIIIMNQEDTPMTRPLFHLALEVSDLDRSTDFYRKLLGTEPARLEDDYARFELAEPGLVLSLNPSSTPRPSRWPNHLGLRLPDLAALEEARSRVLAAGLEPKAEEDTVCCYSRQEKLWLEDPDGTPWELYVVTEADLPQRDERPKGEAPCCAPECCT
jgi:catechol 2,3-dioxygenase-like lactoylglutathione lyase family enzyme